MPRKIAARESLTGGTGDVNPQQFTIQVTQLVADQWNFAAIPNPVPRYPGSTQRAVVMEILRVNWFNASGISAAASSTVFAALATREIAAVGSAPTALAIFSNPSVFSFYNARTFFQTAAGFQIGAVNEQVDELTDGAGHGHLVATDNIFIGIGSTSTLIVNGPIACKITYRMKEIGLAEYVGIVQSQQ